MKTKIKNIFGEKLDILVEGNTQSKDVIIFVHGFGTDKDEGFASYLDLAKYLKNDYLLIRFDLSGFGKSKGKDYDFQFQKAAGDVDSIIRYIREKYPGININIIAHSLGTFTVSILSPNGIKKIIFTSIVNTNTQFVIEELEKRILSHGGKVNKNGITTYPRSHGGVQRIGKDFWKTLKNFDPPEYIRILGDKTDLIVFKPKQDDILSNKYFDKYKRIKNIQYVEVDGDHNFRDPLQRKKLFILIKKFLSSDKTTTTVFGDLRSPDLNYKGWLETVKESCEVEINFPTDGQTFFTDLGKSKKEITVSGSIKSDKNSKVLVVVRTDRDYPQALGKVLKDGKWSFDGCTLGGVDHQIYAVLMDKYDNPVVRSKFISVRLERAS